MTTTILKMQSAPAIPNKVPGVVLVHFLAWTIYIALIYLANLITDPDVSLIKAVFFFLPFVFTFYVCVGMLRTMKILGVGWISLVLFIFFLLMATLGYGYVYLFLPALGVKLYTSSQLDEFFKGALLGLLQYFAYALLYHYVDSNIRKKSEMNQLTEHNLRTQLENSRLREVELRSMQENLLLEQAFLKAEINPHLLHNTLNVLYVQAQALSQPLAENIASLSKMMRFSIETTEGQPGKVPASQEIECLLLLLDIHRMRFSKLKPVNMQVEGSANGHLLPPLSLTTLVEIAMKYGELGEPVTPVMISLVMKENELHFSCRNRIRERPPLFPSAHRGLDNLRRRLDVSFRKLYTMDTHRDENFYTVELTVYRRHV